MAVNSCTAALHLSILAADLKPGDEVITTPLTFCATVNSIIHFKTGGENNWGYPYKEHRPKIDNSYLPGWVYLKEKMAESSS